MHHIPLQRFLQTTVSAVRKLSYNSVHSLNFSFCLFAPLKLAQKCLTSTRSTHYPSHLPLYQRDKLPHVIEIRKGIDIHKLHKQSNLLPDIRPRLSSQRPRRCGRPCGDTVLAASTLPLQSASQRASCPSTPAPIPLRRTVHAPMEREKQIGRAHV